MIQIEYFEHFREENPELGELLPGDWDVRLGEALDRANMRLSELGLVKEGTRDGFGEQIEVNLMSNEQIRVVNREMRGIDKETDVISLCLAKNGALEGEVFGEIFISLEQCAVQAEEIGQSFEEELAFLFIHGILHIFGYDHQTEGEEAEMMGIAYEILGRGEFSG